MSDLIIEVLRTRLDILSDRITLLEDYLFPSKASTKAPIFLKASKGCNDLQTKTQSKPKTNKHKTKSKQKTKDPTKTLDKRLKHFNLLQRKTNS